MHDEFNFPSVVHSRKLARFKLVRHSYLTRTIQDSSSFLQNYFHLLTRVDVLKEWQGSNQNLLLIEDLLILPGRGIWYEPRFLVVFLLVSLYFLIICFVKCCRPFSWFFSMTSIVCFWLVWILSFTIIIWYNLNLNLDKHICRH